MPSIGNIWARFFIQDDATKQMNGIFKGMKSNMAAMATAFAGFNFMKSAVDDANGFVEQQNALQVLLGDNEKKLEAFGQTASKTFGLGQRDVLEYANQLSGVLGITGKTQSETTDMITELEKRISDFGSFRQVTNIDTFMSSVVGGLAGNVSKSLKSYGIFLDETSLKLQIAKGDFEELGVAQDASFASLDNGTKAMIRYQSFLNQTKQSQGDFARTASTSFENTMKIFKSNLQNLKIQIGTKILPMLIKVFTWLGDHLDKVIKSLMILGGLFIGFKLGAFVGEMLKAIALTMALFAGKVASQTGIAALVAVPTAIGAIGGAIGGILGAQGLSLGSSSGGSGATATPESWNPTFNIETSHITGEASLNSQGFNQQGGLGASNGA